ncbi:MAG: putative Signal transduction histidine kinase, LytS [Bacteroidetes bacterium]|nr:putative Signal transduction histidine kinase, LytS [Bacteroidota bacterium]
MKSLFKHIFPFVLVICFISLKGQRQIDSLKKLLRETTFDTIRIEAYNNLAIQYANLDLFVARRYADSALYEISRAQSKPENISPFYEKNKGQSYNTISHIVFQQGKYNESIKYILSTIKIFEKFNDSRNLSRLYSTLAIILKSIGNYKDALLYINIAKKLDEAAYFAKNKNKNVTIDLMGTYLNMGGIFFDLNRHDSSLHYSRKALAMMDSTEKNEDTGLLYTNIGGSYRNLGQYKVANYYAQKALDAYLHIGYPEGTAMAYANFAENYLGLKEYKKALYYVNLSEEINVANLLADDLLANYDTKSKIYAGLNDSKNQIFYLNKYIDLKDSLSKLNHTREMEELKTQYETEKKEVEITKLSKDNEIQELQLEKNRAVRNRLIIIIVAIAVVVILLVLLSVFLTKNIRERKKAYSELQEKNTEIQSQSEKLSHQAKLISKYQSQMNPHFIFNALNNIQGFVMNNQKEKTVTQLQLFSDLMRQTLKNSETETITLEKEITYLKLYTAFEGERFQNKIKFGYEIPEETDAILVPPMMIQPFIENAFKHAGLQNVENAFIHLRIEEKDKLLTIEITDNGKGIENKNIIQTSHALSIISSRLKILFEAQKMQMKEEYFQIISKPYLPVGTTIRICLPLMYKY